MSGLEQQIKYQLGLTEVCFLRFSHPIAKPYQRVTFTLSSNIDGY